jgi:hypothetical protein
VRRCAPPLAAVTVVLAAAFAGPARAQTNLSFEALDERAQLVGWTVAGAAEIAADTAAAVDGQRSLKVTRASPAGVARVTQRLPAAALRSRTAGVQRVRLTGSVRGASAAAAALWLRVDGTHGPLFLDSYGAGREAAELRGETIIAGGAEPTAWRRYEVELPLPADVDEIAFGVSVRGEGSVWFDALELSAVATDSSPAPGPAAVRYLDAALALMRAHALRRANVDWAAVRAEALQHARGATGPAGAQLAVRFALRELGDRHSYLQSAAVSRALEKTAVSNARTGAASLAPAGRRIAGRLAYLQVPSFAGGTPAQQVEFAESLTKLIQLHDEADVCGWAVDLRQNTGGNLWPMLAGLGPLLGEGELATSIYPDGRRVPVWYRDGQAGFGDYTQLRVRSPYRVRESRPVAVLLGPATASSAEVLAVAFRRSPFARSFGAPTRGLSAGNRTFGLADGASLVLTVAATGDAAGRELTGALAPDEAVPDAVAAGRSGADAALEAATAWLEARDACS